VTKKTATTRVWSAKDLLALLRSRHTSDVFVDECKDGPTHGAHHLRMDAWAMRRSWAHPCTYGYEIKVSRSDFVRDDKWHAALPMCNLFSFVCPPGLIRADEVPKEVGVLWASVNGTMMMTKKKAHYRAVEVPESLYRYILMYRTVITDRNCIVDAPDRSVASYWRQWLADKKEDQRVGHMVGKKLWAIYKRDVEAVQRHQEELEHEASALKNLRDVANEMGIPLHYGAGKDVMRQRLKALRRVVPQDLVYQAERAAKEMEGFAGLLREHQDDVVGLAGKEENGP
jgi:hypothetical protein